MTSITSLDLVPITAALVVPLLFVAFNVTKVAQMKETISYSIRQRSDLKTRCRGPPTAPVPTPGFTPGGVEAGPTSRAEEEKTSLPLSKLLLYALIILPMSEIRFACVVLLRGVGHVLDPRHKSRLAGVTKSADRPRNGSSHHSQLEAQACRETLIAGSRRVLAFLSCPALAVHAVRRVSSRAAGLRSIVSSI